jgi:Zn-dependent alcohol dehydrogenase
MKITAAVLDQFGAERPYAKSRPLRLAELKLDEPGPGELLVRIDAAGLCHSDLSAVNGDRPWRMPLAVGHEAAATVVRPGSAQSRFEPGDRVVLAFLASCGECVRCAGGQGFLCAPGAQANREGRLLTGGRRLFQEGQGVFHHLGVSAFADHAVIDERSAVKIAPDVKPEIAALFGCAVMTGVGAVTNTAGLRMGESLAIWGLGGVGLAALLGGIAAGAQPVVAVDPMPAKRALALELGATAAADPAEAQELIADLTGGGADVVIETAGRIDALDAAFKATCRGGRTVTVGLPHPDARLALPAAQLVGEGRTLMGSYMGSSIPRRDIPRYIGLWRAGRLPVERLLTSVRPLADINEMLDELADGRAVRQVLTP